MKASPHRVAALAACPEPNAVAQMRSFIGAFKVLSRVIRGCSALLTNLDDAVAGRESKEPIQLTDDLHASFNQAQAVLSQTRTITLRRPDDQLWIVTDVAVRTPGIGAALYLSRAGKLHLAGFFSVILRDSQSRWLPCEIEVLPIAVSKNRVIPYLIQSHQSFCPNR